MPRNRSAGRPAPSRSSPPSHQTRQASTSSNVPARTTPAAPPTHAQQTAQPPAVPTQGGGMLSNIMSTAVGVGVGHAIGHGLTGLFGGGSSAPAATDNAAAATPETNSNTRIGACDADAKAFTRCMDDYKGDMTVCSWYLEQLKSCQQMASQY